MDAIRTENWGRYKIGRGEPVVSYLGRVRAELAQLENLSRIQWTSRVPWRTHTAPSGCWICDTFGLLHGVLGLIEESFPEEAEQAEGQGINELSPRTVGQSTEEDKSPV